MRRHGMWLAACIILTLAAVSAQAQGPVPPLAAAKQVVIAPPGAKWMAVAAQAQAGPAQVLAVQTTAQMTKLKLTLPGYHQSALTRQGMQFQRLAIPGGGLTAEVGMPEVPTVRQFVAVPEGATATLNVQMGKSRTVKNLVLLPVQEPVPEQGRLEMPFKMNQNFYQQRTLYPSEAAMVSEPMMMGRTRVVLVEFAPMQYNPGEKTLLIHDDMQVDVSFSRAAAKLAPSAAITAATPTLIGVINAGRFGDLVAISREWEYLIICADAFAEEVQPLVDWKRSKGLTVHVARISDVGATSAQVQNFIRAAFENRSTRYVLLAGDVDTVPKYTYTGPAGSCASDYYYTLVSGGDLLPDLAVGRFSGRTEAEITHMVEKAVAYEKTPMTPSLDWYKRATCISDAGYFQDTSNWVATFLGGHGYTVQKLYHTMGNATSTNVRNAVNQGRAIVNYRGHGGVTGWSTSGFNNTAVNNLTNGRMMPVIISPTCLTGYYDHTGDCYGETWVKTHAASDPRGAITYWGSSRISYGGYNDELCKGSYKAVFNDGLHAMGDVVNKAKLYMIGAYGFSDTAKLELHMFTLFGDPELNVRTEKPLIRAIRPRVVVPRP